MLKGTDLLRELVAKVKDAATDVAFCTLTRERENRISADILRLKLQIQETAVSWPRESEEDENLIQVKWTLNRLLDNIPELLHLRGLSSYSRKRLIEQLADLEELFQRSG